MDWRRLCVGCNVCLTPVPFACFRYADEVFNKLENGAHIYFCGLKGMMPGIQDMLKAVATKKGLDYEEWLKGLKAKKQWHVEVY